MRLSRVAPAALAALLTVVSFIAIVHPASAYGGYWWNGTSADAPQYQWRYRPILMGTQLMLGQASPPYWGICSAGYPAYIMDEISEGRYKVTFGIVVSGHCTDPYQLVYQNDTSSSSNYIGYALYVYKGEGVEADVAFIATYESYFISEGDPIPQPQLVSPYILLPDGTTAIIDSYIEEYADLVMTYYFGEMLVRAGRSTGLEAGYIIPCPDGTADIVCQTEWGDYVFPLDAGAAEGDSGGPVFKLRYEKLDVVWVAYAKIYGIASAYCYVLPNVDESCLQCSTQPPAPTPCGPILATPVYIIHQVLPDVIPYAAGG